MHFAVCSIGVALKGFIISTLTIKVKTSIIMSRKKREICEIKINQLFVKSNGNKINLRSNDALYKQIAKGLKIPHKIVYRMVRRYQPYVRIDER